MTALGPAWQTLADNIKAVERIARSAHSRMKADESANLKIAALHSLLGERFENFGTPTAFGALAQVMDQFEELARGMETELQATLDKIRAKVAGDLSDSMSQIVTD